MKILFFSSDNSYTSGAFISMANLAKKVSLQGHTVRIVIPFEGDGEKLLDEMQIDYKIIHMNSWIVPCNPIRVYSWLKCLCGMGINRLLYSKRVRDELEAYEPDIVHINGLWGYLGAVEAHLKSTPVVWHIREFLEEDQGRRILFRKKGYELISRSAYAICISDALKRKYGRVLKCDNLVVAYNGIDSSSYLCAKHKLFSMDKIQLLIVGGVTLNKGQYKVVKDFDKHSDGTMELTIVGGTNGINKLLWPLFLKIHSNPDVHYVGRQYNVTEYYQKADIFIMASKSEAWGRVTAEAMLGGCLAVGADTGATPELIIDGNTGYLFDHNSFDMMETIKKALVDKSNAETIAHNGTRYIEENYSLAENAARVIGLYSSLQV